MKALDRFVLLLGLLPLITSAQDQKELAIIIDNAPLLQDTLYAHSVITYLHKGTVVLKDYFIESPGNWIYIENGDDSITLSGYVHKTWVVQLDTLPEYKGTDVGLRFTIVVKDATELTDASFINYGNDNCVYEFYLVEKMELYWQGKWIDQPDILFKDLCALWFEAGTFSTFDSEGFKIYKIDKFYYIRHDGGDGASAYDVIWAIKAGKIIQRLIDII